MPGNNIKLGESSDKDAATKAMFATDMAKMRSQQQEGMKKVADQQSWEQGWADVRKARSQSAESYKKSRQDRFNTKYK